MLSRTSRNPLFFVAKFSPKITHYANLARHVRETNTKFVHRCIRLNKVKISHAWFEKSELFFSFFKPFNPF